MDVFSKDLMAVQDEIKKIETRLTQLMEKDRAKIAEYEHGGKMVRFVELTNELADYLGKRVGLTPQEAIESLKSGRKIYVSPSYYYQIEKRGHRTK